MGESRIQGVGRGGESDGEDIHKANCRERGQERKKGYIETRD
ncbi:hypothetical protein [Clostridioides difficile]|nr:hypothetical protein [Clostridioides difficile]